MKVQVGSPYYAFSKTAITWSAPSLHNATFLILAETMIAWLWKKVLNLRKVVRAILTSTAYNIIVLYIVFLKSSLFSFPNDNSDLQLELGNEHMVQSQTQPDHWKLVLDPYASKIKSLGFFPHFSY